MALASVIDCTMHGTWWDAAAVARHSSEWGLVPFAINTRQSNLNTRQSSLGLTDSLSVNTKQHGVD